MDDSVAEVAGELVQRLIEQPGWDALMETLDLYEREQTYLLMTSNPQENPAEYERHFGRLDGLRLLPALAEGVVKYGREARERRNAHVA